MRQSYVAIIILRDIYYDFIRHCHEVRSQAILKITQFRGLTWGAVVIHELLLLGLTEFFELMSR